MKVFVGLTKKTAQPESGIGQVVHAQWDHLPQNGIELVSRADQADVIALHIKNGHYPRIDVLHCHGLYFSDLPHLSYSTWNYTVNSEIAEAARRSVAVTVPSQWVAMPFLRDMRLKPHVIGHGIDVEKWDHAQQKSGFILYNKNREGDVCSSDPAWQLAKRGYEVVSTFSPFGKPALKNMAVIGIVPHPEMKRWVEKASIYLATTMETFGIGILEALAAGVPVLGYRWGGILDIVEHEKSGYLVDPDDIDGLEAGVKYIIANYGRMARAARSRAEEFSWKKIMKKYADLYRGVAEEIKKEKTARVAVVIPNYNYGEYIEDAINSAKNQTIPPDEIIVIDDGSTDDSLKILSKLDGIKLILQKNQGVAAARNNGIRAASAQFIQLLDADDRLGKTTIEKCKDAMIENRGLGIAYGSLAFVDGEGKTGEKHAWPPQFSWDVISKPHVPPSNCIPSCCMIRKTMWERSGGVRQEYAPGEDVEFWLRGLSVGFEAEKVTDDITHEYRWHTGSASTTKKYIAIDDDKPWMRDQIYPFGSPTANNYRKKVLSYAMPDIAVIIPVGPGHAKYIPRALDSIIGQTFRNWEVVLVDDTGNSDEWKSVDWKPYPFARVVRTTGKRGAGDARNLGVDASKAPLILFLDADDYLMPTALNDMFDAFIENDQCGYIYSDWYSADHNKVERHETDEFRQDEWRMQHAITVLMKKHDFYEVGAFNPILDSWEDWDFFLRCTIKGVCGKRVPKPLFLYHFHTGNRRMFALKQSGDMSDYGKSALSLFKREYSDYFTGVKTMSKCCGGKSSAPVLQAKRIIGTYKEVQLEEGDNMALPEKVRMKYIASNPGAISFNVNGRIYRGGNNPFNMFSDVKRDDVQKLLNTGKWEIVRTTPQAVPAEDNPIPSIEPQVDMEDLARRRLAEAKKYLVDLDAPIESAKESDTSDAEDSKAMEADIYPSDTGNPKDIIKVEADQVIDVPASGASMGAAKTSKAAASRGSRKSGRPPKPQKNEEKE